MLLGFVAEAIFPLVALGRVPTFLDDVTMLAELINRYGESMAYAVAEFSSRVPFAVFEDVAQLLVLGEDGAETEVALIGHR